MTVYAAVTTGQGTGAISTIQLFGDSAEAVIRKVFKPAGTRPVTFKTGKILLGTVADGTEVIDQVTVGCEQDGSFAINCHGNPLIVEMIMQLLQRCGAELLTAEQLIPKILASQESTNTIESEAKLAQPKARTIQGTKIFANQIDAGLSERAQNWLANINEISLDQIGAEAADIMQKSQTAKLIIYGCKAALIGPPNSGKSTLLNCLAGRQKALVTDIKGTTRDWVEATCRIEPLSLTLIDTAGLDEKIAVPNDTVEKAAQKKTSEILEQADIILLVLDNNQPLEELDEQFSRKVVGKNIVTVLNKSDLPAKLDSSRLLQILSNTVLISAKEGTGIENLIEKILQSCGVADFDLRQPVCFTGRQENLLRQLQNAKSKQRAASVIAELLNGQVRV